MSNKIFQIGLNKCGTLSIHNLVKNSGYKSVHWEKGVIARQIFLNLSMGAPILNRIDKFDCFSDMQDTDLNIYAYRYLEHFYKEYKNSYFILNTRNKDDWLRSRSNHKKGLLLNLSKKQFGLNVRQTLSLWSLEWDHHHKNVEKFFKRKGNFIKFHLNDDPIEKLIEFVKPDFQLNKNHWKVANKSGYNPQNKLV